jgi:hypothetical protein
MATANLLQTSVSGGTQNALSLQGDGVFFPKASTTSRLALTLTTTDKGFIVYDTTDNNIYFWNGTAWESIPGSGDAGANGSVQYNDNGTVSGASNFTYNKATSAVSIAGDLTVRTTGLIVNTTGVGVGMTPVNNLDVGSATFASVGTKIDSITQSSQIFKGTPDAVGYEYAKIVSGREASPSTYGSFLAFYTESKASGTTDTSVERARFNSTGNLAFADGKGIDFSATAGTGTSELLADYEEGTFTATLTGGTTNPTIPVTTTARYTKVGRLVTVQIEFIGVTTVGASGVIQITGLPFPNGSVASTGIATLYNLATFAGSPVVYLDPSTNTLALYGLVSNSVYSSVTHNAGVNGYSTTTITYSV